MMRRALFLACLMTFLLLCSPVVADVPPVKLFMGIDTASEAKAKFATAFADKVFRNRERSGPKAPAQIEIIVLGEAFKLLIDGASPITDDVRRFEQKGWHFKLVGCGKAVATMRGYLSDGKTKLLPGAELSDEGPGDLRKKLIADDWTEVAIPEDL